MKQKLLLLAMLIATVFTAKAQKEFTSSVESYPNTEWVAANAVYDMEAVGAALGYADALAFHDDLLEACTSNGASGTLTIYNIDGNGKETLATGAANYNHTEDGGVNWVNFTYGCFWLNDNSESVEWGEGNKFWTHVDWMLEENELRIGMGQMAYENNSSGLAPGTTWTSRTKLVHDGNVVVLRSTLVIIAPPALPDPVTDPEALNIVADVKIEVTQEVMTDWDSDGTKNPQWSVDGKALMLASGADPNAVAANMASIFYMPAWDNISDMISSTLTADHSANGNGFWCVRTVDPDTEALTDYCVQGTYGSSDFFVENISFNIADSTFYGGSGQMINKFKGGEHMYTHLYFIVGDQAIRVEFHFNVEKDVEYEPADMQMVGETTMTWAQEPRSDTSGLKKWVLNYDEVLEKLGCDISRVRLKLYQPDGTLVSETNTDNNGFWVDDAGYKTAIGEGVTAFYVDYTTDDMAFNVGQYSNSTTAGDEFEALIWLCYKEKYYQVRVILTVQDLQKAAAEDYHEVGHYSYEMRSLIDGTWNSTEFQTTPLDMAEVAELLGTDDYVVYAYAADQWTTGYTCTPYPGFWYSAADAVVGWGDAHIGLRFERNYLAVHKNPQQEEVAGNNYTHSIYLVNESTGAYVRLTVKVTFVDEIINYEKVGEDLFTVYVDPNVDEGYALKVYDATEMFKALGISTDDFWYGEVEVQEWDGEHYEMINERGLFEYFFDAGGKAVADDGSDFSFQVVFEPGLDNEINITGRIEDLDPDDLSGQERSTVFCIQSGTKQFFFTVRLFYGLEDSIEMIEDDESGMKNGAAVYDLAGRRIVGNGQWSKNNAGLPKGLYIINEQKVLY